MDSEEKLAVYLDGETGIGWYHQVPATRPDEFGTISRSGGGRGEVVEDSGLYTLKVWAGTWARVRELTRAASLAVSTAQFGIDTAMASSVVSIYDDPDEGAPRRRITAQITFND